MGSWLQGVLGRAWGDQDQSAAGLALTPPHSLNHPRSPERSSSDPGVSDKRWTRGLTSKVFPSPESVQIQGWICHHNEALGPLTELSLGPPQEPAESQHRASASEVHLPSDVKNQEGHEGCGP